MPIGHMEEEVTLSNLERLAARRAAAALRAKLAGPQSREAETQTDDKDHARGTEEPALALGLTFFVTSCSRSPNELPGTARSRLYQNEIWREQLALAL